MTPAGPGGGADPADPPLLAVKVGGSLYSDKSVPGHLDEKAIAEYARQVAGLARRYPGRLVLVAGGGAVGHGAVRDRAPADPFGLVRLTEATAQVRAAWTGALRRAGVPAMPLQVAALCVLGPVGPVGQGAAVRAVLRAGAVPVLSGDCVFDPAGGLHAFSSDRVPELLVDAVPGRWRVVVLTDVPGLLADGGRGEVLAEVDADAPAPAYGLLWDSGPWDSTGGMRTKLDALLACARRGAECVVLRGDPARPDLEFLADPPAAWPVGVARTWIARRTPAGSARPETQPEARPEAQPEAQPETQPGAPARAGVGRRAGAGADNYPARVAAQATVARVVDLGVLRLRLSATRADFPGFSYFARFQPDGTPVDYEVSCVDLDDADVDVDRLDRLTDRTVRAKRFRAGYYLVHYFGEPAYLVTRGRHLLVVGRKLERTVWPYFVKHLLTVHAVEHGYLHLKAGGLVRPDGGGTLLFGRNGGGKTVFGTQACLAGAEFLTNTHALVRARTAYGVPSSIRVREDACFGPLVAAGRLHRHMESGDYIATPPELFPGRTRDSARVDTLVVVDYQPGRPPSVEDVPAPAMRAFLEQFAAAVPVYGLKDDLLAHCGDDFDRFTAATQAMADRLADLVHGCRRLRVSADMLDPAVRTAVLGRLGGW